MSNYLLGAEFDPNAPWNQKERDVCTCCNGEGEIEDCYEPDYDE